MLNGKNKLITAVVTIVPNDTVRYISNYSSGKMGIALADCAYKQGANVELVTTVDVEKPYTVTKVKTAQDMQKAVEQSFAQTDCIIMAAAVADYRAQNVANYKMKKTDDGNEISIELVKNPDILKEICQKRTTSHPLIVGFCAESENLLKNAKEKLVKKGCDYLIANDISRKDIGFSSDYNEVTILSKNGDFRLRGYNQTNDRYFTKSTLTTQGIGIMYNKDFSNWKELIDWFLRRRKLRTSRQKKNDEEKYSQPQTIARPADEEKTSSPDKDNKEN